MTNNKFALLLVNPRAGSSNMELLNQILPPTLNQYGWTVRTEFVSKGTRPDAFIPLLQEAVLSGTTFVIACGGDGTASLVATAIIQSGLKDQLRLGIFPSGTANSLARELGIPSDWSTAALLLACSGTSTYLDAMKMGEQFYFLRIGIGLDAETIRDTNRQSKRWFGRWAYLKTFLGFAFNPHRVRFRCIIDGHRRRFWAVQVFVANGGGIALAPFRIGPDINFNDGVLNLCAYDALSWWDYFTVGWRLFRKDYYRHPLLKFYAVRHAVSVQTRQPLPVHGDGEVCTATPVTIHVIPNALQVISFQQ